MKLKLENDFEKFIASFFLVVGLIVLIQTTPWAPEWKILIWIAIAVGAVQRIWTNK